MADLGLFDIFGQFGHPQHRHCVHHHRARLGRRQPTGDHGRVVGASDQNAVAGFYTQVVDQCMGQAIGPIGQFLVCSPTPIADQCGMVAKALFDHSVSQFDRSVEPFGIGEPIQ